MQMQQKAMDHTVSFICRISRKLIVEWWLPEMRRTKKQEGQGDQWVESYS